VFSLLSENRSNSMGDLVSDGDPILFDDDEVEAASHWYGGQGSMLYAVTSTGALSRGTIRPRHEDEDRTPMTNEEWMAYLASALESEASEAARDAAAQAKKSKGRERAELKKDEQALLSIAAKAAACASGE